MTESYLFWSIVGMFAVTFPVRFLPLFVFNRISVPRLVKKWLTAIPIAIYASLITQIFVEPIGKVDLLEQRPLWLASLLTLAITVKTKSIGWGMGLGFGIFVGLTLLIH